MTSKTKMFLINPSNMTSKIQKDFDDIDKGTKHIVVHSINEVIRLLESNPPEVNYKLHVYPDNITEIQKYIDYLIEFQLSNQIDFQFVINADTERLLWNKFINEGEIINVS